MKKSFIIALVAIATVFAVSCNKDKTIKLPGTSWAYNLESSLYGQKVVFNDTLNIVDKENIDRRISFIAGPADTTDRMSCTYTWDGVTLTLLDSEGGPMNGMIFTYRETDNVFLRDLGNDEEMGTILQMMGVTEIAYSQVK